jgi:hypothetical protein
MTIPSRLDDDNIIKEDWEELLTFSRMLLIDEDDQAPKLLDEGWLLEDELKDKKRRQEQYKRNQAIPMIRQQRQQEPEN